MFAKMHHFCTFYGIFLCVNSCRNPKSMIFNLNWNIRHEIKCGPYCKRLEERKARGNFASLCKLMRHSRLDLPLTEVERLRTHVREMFFPKKQATFFRLLARGWTGGGKSSFQRFASMKTSVSAAKAPQRPKWIKLLEGLKEDNSVFSLKGSLICMPL